MSIIVRVVFWSKRHSEAFRLLDATKCGFSFYRLPLHRAITSDCSRVPARRRHIDEGMILVAPIEEIRRGGRTIRLRKCSGVEAFSSAKSEAFALFPKWLRKPQNLGVNIGVLALGLACAASLCGQYDRHHRFSWQEACFKNPGLPYCQGHDFAVKRTKDGKTPSADTSTGTSLSSAVDASGIDWRFADPSADAIAVLNCSKLSAAPVAHSLIDQLGANQGLGPTDVQNIFRGLSGVTEVALSVRGDRMVVMVIGRAPDSILPALEVGWKALSLDGNAMLIGHADAVEQAAQRIWAASPLGELAEIALERQTDGEFWAVGVPKLAGQGALTAGIKRFSLTASMRDRLTSDTAFEFDGVPDAVVIRPWLNTLANAKFDGNAIRSQMSMNGDEMRESFGQIATSPFGQRLGAFIQPARYLPVRDTATTVHTKPVIFGLDDGPKEVGREPHQ